MLGLAAFFPAGRFEALAQDTNGASAHAVLPLRLALPTDNDAIFSRDPSAFYMYTYRTFEGVSSRPWSAGRFGFVRNQRRTPAGIIFTRFHEGIDIRPTQRSPSGEPLDEIRAIAEGRVAHTSQVSSHSNYGRYVVVRHDWPSGPVYSLYAHLSDIDVKPGDRVRLGDRLGRMGYTGAGINRERAHLHLELTLMLSERFQSWFDRHFTTPNRHGIHNGINLVGLDIAGLYHTLKAEPTTSLPQFFAMVPAYYRVAVPMIGPFPFLERYPWLGHDLGGAADPASWEITFSANGLPLRIDAIDRRVTRPTVTWVRESPVSHGYNTLSRLSGEGGQASLTASGERYLQLLTDQFP